jgi:hypothetical protein
MKALRITFGCAALLAYLLLFAAGMLVSSEPYRKQLAEHSVSISPVAVATAANVATPPVTAQPLTSAEMFKAFLLAMLLYTPTNVALLTILAGFVGGCASYLTYAEASTELRAKGTDQPAPDLRALFRTESPFASMFRSLLVYLATMAGIFVTTSEPFATPTAEQYVRLAAAISVFAFIVGYDPTKFHDIVDMMPKRKN